MLRTQLERVAEEAATDGYVMGERYDMGHVYYVDGTHWHGAAHYYEYPCVYSWVLLHEYLGVRAALDVDLEVAPLLADHGGVELGQSAYRLSYRWDSDGFRLTNAADTERTFRIDLSGMIAASSPRVVTLPAGGSVVLTPEEVGA
jgi:hypothetical protein